MNTYHYENSDEIDFYNNLCVCGHALYLHAFTSDYVDTIRTSQCTFCGWHDDEDGKRVPDCSHFRGSITKQSEIGL